MKRKKIIILVVMTFIVLILVGRMSLCEMLNQPNFRTSITIFDSKSDGFFISTYQVVPEDLLKLKDLGFAIDTIWSEKSWGYDCTCFGKVKSENWKNNLVFPVGTIYNDDTHSSFSFELDSTNKNFTTGFDVNMKRYSFSPTHLQDTLKIRLTAPDSIEGWKNKVEIFEFEITKDNS